MVLSSSVWSMRARAVGSVLWPASINVACFFQLSDFVYAWYCASKFSHSQTLSSAGCCAGTLDQGTGCLEVFDEQEEDKMYPAALDVIKNMGGVVDSLFARSQKLVA